MITRLVETHTKQAQSPDAGGVGTPPPLKASGFCGTDFVHQENVEWASRNALHPIPHAAAVDCLNNGTRLEIPTAQKNIRRLIRQNELRAYYDLYKKLPTTLEQLNDGLRKYGK